MYDRSMLLRSLALAALGFGCGSGGNQLPRDRVTSAGEALFNGYTKPDVKCFECHDGTGHGSTWGPSLVQRVPRRTDDELAATIRGGKGKMPAFRDKLTDPEIAQLVTWLRSTFGH